jgi:hypothetical protein
VSGPWSRATPASRASGPRSQPSAPAPIHAPRSYAPAQSQPGPLRAAVARAAARLRGGEVHAPRSPAGAPVHPPTSSATPPRPLAGPRSHAEAAAQVSGPQAPAPLTLARSARTVARAPRPLPAARPANGQPAAELAAAAQAAGAEVRSGPDFMEISFPPPPGAAPATVARTAAASGAVTRPLAEAAALPPAATAPRTLGTPSALARSTGAGGSGGSANDSVVDAVLKALREENEHLGIIDGIDPLF